MTPSTAAAPIPQSHTRRSSWNLGAAALVALVVSVVYSNSLHGPFIFDDIGSIPGNPTIRSLRHLTQVLRPPGGMLAVEGRPLVNLSLAINYALHQFSVEGYHLFNIAVHVLASLTLFGLVRRTLTLPLMAPRWAGAAMPLALAVALVWGVHPLTTEPVNGIVQRGESLMALFYLLTLYCAAQAMASRHALGWGMGAVAACALGMASKEVMASAPLLVWLYDRTFVAGSFRAAVARRKYLLGGLALTWLVLLACILSFYSTQGTGGLEQGISPWRYLATQGGATCRYLELVFWPQTLVLDYGSTLAYGPAAIIPGAILVTALLAATLWALRRRPAAGFLGAAFFLILAPSSSIIPLATQTIAEKRMYLPLAAVLVLAVCGGWRAWTKWTCQTTTGGNNPHGPAFRTAGRILAGVFLAAAVVALGFRTWQRNGDYADDLQMWALTCRQQPENWRALNNWGDALFQRNEYGAAYDRFCQALALRPDFGMGYYNRGNAAKALGLYGQALTDYDRALSYHYDPGRVYNNRATARWALKQYDLALADYTQAIAYLPDNAAIYANRGATYQIQQRWAEALADFSQAIKRQPAVAPYYMNRGDTFRQLGRFADAAADYTRALEIRTGLATGDEARIYGQRAGCWDQLGQTDRARADVAECRKSGGQVDPQLLQHLGMKGP